MKTKLQLPTVQFREIEIDLDELENFCETHTNHRLSGEIHRYKAGRSHHNYLEEFLEGVYFFLKSVYPDVYEEYFDPYFEYEVLQNS